MRLGIQRSRIWVSWSANGRADAQAAEGSAVQSAQLTCKKLDAFIQALGNAKPARQAQAAIRGTAPTSDGLVIAHTGEDFGGVSVFVFPESTKDAAGFNADPSGRREGLPTPGNQQGH